MSDNKQDNTGGLSCEDLDELKALMNDEAFEMLLFHGMETLEEGRSEISLIGMDSTHISLRLQYGVVNMDESFGRSTSYMAVCECKVPISLVKDRTIGNGVNLERLRLVMLLFRLQNSDIQKHTGFSKAYISGVVSGKVRGSQQFWIKLNSVLPSIITAIGSGCCVFEI
jgi:hypothetical protein